MNNHTYTILFILIFAIGGCKKDSQSSYVLNSNSNNSNSDFSEYDFSPFWLNFTFTSGNCGACGHNSEPQLAAMMSKDENRGKRFLVQYHVDYWDKSAKDYPDPVGKSEYTNHWITFGSSVVKPTGLGAPGGVFTPVAYAGGAESKRYPYSGSSISDLNNYLDTAFSYTPAYALNIKITSSLENLTELIGSYSIKNKNMKYDLEKIQLRFALIEDSIKFKSLKGENKGLDQTFTNAVRADIVILPGENGEGTFELKNLPSGIVTKQCSIIGWVETIKSSTVASKTNWGTIKAANSVGLVD